LVEKEGRLTIEEAAAKKSTLEQRLRQGSGASGAIKVSGRRKAGGPHFAGEERKGGDGGQEQGETSIKQEKNR